MHPTIIKNDALRASISALNDWTHMYAPAFCDERAVVESYHRIRDNGGTLAYIADTILQCKKALGE